MEPFDPSQDHSPLRAGMLSDRGLVHEKNEDACLVDVERGLFAVADGVGGQPAGDVAARLTIDRLPDLVESAVRGRPPEDVGAAVSEAVVELSAAVQAEAATRPELEGMAATVVMALVDGEIAHVVHVGDSRAYLTRGGRLHRLTNDHSLAAELVQSGVISADEANNHPFAHSITQAIGLPADLEPAVLALELVPGDRLLLCSDGLTDMVAEDGIAAILTAGADPVATCHGLVEAANGAGGKDNITVVVVDYSPTDAGPS
jgi:PPM family protein phosphatase